MTKEGSTQKIMIFEVTRVVIDPQTSQRPATTWPVFGLPPNYSPPYDNMPRLGQPIHIVFQVPVVAEPQLVMHTVATATYEEP